MKKEYADILECAGHGFWEWNPSTNVVFFSNQWVCMLGYDYAQFPQSLDEWITRIHPDDLSPCLNALAELLSGKTTFYRHQHRMLCKDGTYKWILDQAKIIAYNSHGYPCKIVGTHTDIDDIK